MRVLEEQLPGCRLLATDCFADDRGYFRKLWTRADSAFGSCEGGYSQTAISFNRLAGTLRGLHFQAYPHLEHKLVQCVAGAIFDVMVDLRPESSSYGRWYGATLSAENANALYSEPGFAHGFVTLTDDACVHYQIAPDFVQGAACGVRYDDPDLAIEWPTTIKVVSERDRLLPLSSDLDLSLLRGGRDR